MNRRILATAAVVFVCLVVGATWWSTRPEPVDPQVQRVRAMGEKISLVMESAEPSPAAGETFQELRTEVESLSPEQRRQLIGQGPPPFIRKMQERIEKYFEMPPEERTALLDAEIDRMEKMFRNMPFPPGGGGPFDGMSGERRNEMQRGFLDATTPQQRAQMSEFMTDMQKRRQERGLPALPPPPF